MAGSGTVHLRPDQERLLSAEHVVVEFDAGVHGKVQAVSDVSLDVLPGESLGIVGESGCGKSSLLRALIQLPKATSGSIKLQGRELTSLHERQLRPLRPAMQMLFQDPVTALNPRRQVHQLLAEGPSMWRKEDRPSKDELGEMLESVGLDRDVVWDRRPRALSGGQCQRVSLARALLLQPKLLLCDEPVSALDVSVQAQILNLIADVRKRYDLSLVFVAHDLAVVRHVSDRVLVMYLGKVCEVAPADSIFAVPAHPYTQLLLDSVLEPGVPAEREPLIDAGDPPSPLDPPSGCRFRTRCPRADERCAAEEPVLAELASGHFAACHYPDVPVQLGARG
jgi:peptide/nickel transport system ATP-binding protein